MPKRCTDPMIAVPMIRGDVLDVACTTGVGSMHV